MKLQPFIYFSEALVAQRDILGLISKCSKDLGYKCDRELLEKLWHEVTGTTKAQHRKYSLLSSEYKQKALRKHNHNILDQLQPAIHTPNMQKIDSKLAEQVFKGMADPRLWQPVPETLEYIAKLEQNSVKWGIIANEDHLYPLALRQMGLKPHRLVNAHGHTFKPLPKMFHSAWSKVPAENQHDVFFVGDVNRAYDNVVSPYMRCVLHTHGQTLDTSSPQHMRIRNLDDLDDLLGFSEVEELEFDMGAAELIRELELPEGLPRAVLLDKGAKELALADVK